MPPGSSTDRHYRDPALAALYDLGCGWSADRDFYLALAAGGQKRILDLGCGTGLLCDAYAVAGHDVTGVDPADAMLAVAREKPNGSKIDWHLSSAQAFRTARRFDLIVMTGHAFQTLHREDDIRKALATMRDHLADGGTIAFETRNPAIDWAAVWDYDTKLNLSDTLVRETRRFVHRRGRRLSFELRYSFPDKELVSPSEISFYSRSEIEAQLGAAGLRVRALYGDWDKSAFNEGSSQEIIFIAGR